MRTLQAWPGTGSPRAVVLMLHGGAETGLEEVTGRSGPYLRSLLMARAIRPRLASHGLDLALLRFSVRGWNADHGDPSPLADARWALGAVSKRYGPVPVVLLGHSMGARTALHVAGDPAAAGVVGLAPWFPEDDDVSAVAGKPLVAAHGSRDTLTSPRHTHALLDRAEAAGSPTRFVDMGPLGHYMLRHARAWNRVAAEACVGVLDHI